MGEKEKDLSLEEMQLLVDEKSIELGKSLNVKVTPLLFEVNGDWIVGYLKSPNRNAVRVAYDKYEKYGKLEAGALLLEICLIQENSDKRIIDENPLYDGINNWACMEAFKLIEFSISLTKKNMSLIS